MHLVWVPMGLAALRCSGLSPWGIWALACDGQLWLESPSLETARFKWPQLAAGRGGELRNKTLVFQCPCM